jgi:ABC-type transporter Mla subunit MlaD
MFKNAQSVTIKSTQELVATINARIEVHDYSAVNELLEHLAEASYRLQRIVESGIDLECSYRDIREVINARLVSAARDIEVAESYILMRQKLDLVKLIALYLPSHLSEENKDLPVRLDAILRERVTHQSAETLAQIGTLSKTGNHFIEEIGKYLTEILAHNLDRLAEVHQLFDGCTFYQSATTSLSDALAHHRTSFLDGLAQEPTPAHLPLNFKVLKDFNCCQSLVSHTVVSQGLYESMEKALLQL